MSENRREQLLKTFPKRENFADEDDYEEAAAFWRHRTGRFLNENPQLVNQPATETEATPDNEQMEMHRQHTDYLTKKLQSSEEPEKREPSGRFGGTNLFKNHPELTQEEADEMAEAFGF